MMAAAMFTASVFRLRRTSALSIVLAASLVASACATAPPVVLAPPPPPPADLKLSWILRLEDQRVLRDPVPEPVTVRSPGSAPTGAETPALAAPPPQRPDLIALLADPEARLRRRAALALGRVGLAEAVLPLVERLADPEAEVRQMAAFALGLIGDASAAGPLHLALDDPSAKVQGRAAQALGRVGDSAAAGAIGALVERHVPAAFDVDPEDLSYPQRDEVEAFRLGLYALADLGAFDPLARAILEEDQPILWWWPVAYALQQLEDPRALDALTTLAGVQGSVGVALAARGLGAIGDPRAVAPLVALLDRDRRDDRVVASAIRALGAIDDDRAVAALDTFVRARDLDPRLRLEAIDALGGLASGRSVDVFTELLSHPWPPLRAASLRALAAADPEAYVLTLSGYGSDSDWRVRVAIADGLRQVDPDAAHYRLALMLTDEDPRVVPSVLEALVAVRAPDAAATLTEYLASPDVVVRRTAARLLGELQPEGAEAALADAYRAGRSDASYLARSAALEALAAYGGPLAVETLRSAIDDVDWAVRVHAAELLGTLEPGDDYDGAIRPAPEHRGVDYAAPHLIRPTVSPHVYIETVRGTIQIELAVIDAPLTSDSFVTLARQGFFDGLSFHRVVPNYVAQGGDPRHDSEGGPGYTLRDELNETPYLRGTVGMALDWRDTGGSQFFITHSPQPQLDSRYTAFGRVVSGMDVVDALQPGDRIDRVLVWDGEQPLGAQAR